MELFDLHCDTLLEAYKSRQSLYSNSLMGDVKRALNVFDHYTQIYAIYSENELEPEAAWKQYQAVRQYYSRQMPLPENTSAILAVEGGMLLNGDLSRLDTLYADGVRVLTPVWGGRCCIGGAHDTGEGLTAFGEAVIKHCFELGITVDVSHASDEMFRQIAELAAVSELPFIASHSCSRALCNHSRNLTDGMFRTIINSGGIVGVNLVTEHLCGGRRCAAETVLRHIEHFMALGGERAVCLGCDLDGTDNLPDGIRNIGDLPYLAELMLQNNYSEQNVNNIFYLNSRNFFKQWQKI